jgi:hypothetical protein
MFSECLIILFTVEISKFLHSELQIFTNVREIFGRISSFICEDHFSYESLFSHANPLEYYFLSSIKFTLPTLWDRHLLEKLIVAKLVRELSGF